VPVVAGVAWSCMKGFTIEVNVAAFIGAMVSNLAFALRSIYMKQALKDKAACTAKNLDSANVYAVYTIFAFILSIPLAYFFEGEKLTSAWASGEVTAKISEMEIVKLNLITGLFFYLYNESASLALGNLDGVAHAVCNTVKRVVIMIAMFVSGLEDKPMTTQKMTGAAVAIGGTLLYAVVKNNVAKAEAKAKKA